MPDTFNPDYSWLKTWKENASPPTIFYSTTSDLVPSIRKEGLVPFSEQEGFFMECIREVLVLARKLDNRRTIEFAEIQLMEHGERPSPLRLTFSHRHALGEIERKSRRLKALQWLYEVFLEQLDKCASGEPAAAEVDELRKKYGELKGIRSTTQGAIIHVATDLQKFDSLPSLVEDKKSLRRAIKGKGPLCEVYGPQDRKWKKLPREEVEACIEAMVRGREGVAGLEGLGCEITTSEVIPPPDIVKVEFVQL
jgi:hypothetical protein